MPIDIGRHANRGVAELRTDVFQAFAIAQEQTRERMARIVDAPAPDLRAIASFPKDAVPPIVHIDVIPIPAGDLFSLAPNNLPGAQKDQVRDLVLAFGEIFRLTCL